MPDSLSTNYGFTKPEEGGSPGTWDTKLNANLDLLDGELAKPRIIQSALAWGATTTLDLALARVFTGTNTGISTIAFSNVPSATFAVRVLLVLTNGGANVITWPASVVWLSGSYPVLKVSGVDVIELVTRDGGTTWYAQPVFERNPPVDSTTTDSGAGSPANLKSYVIPAGLLAADGQGLRIRGWGYSANNANAKSVRVALGSFTLGQTLQVSIVDYWRFEVLIYRVNATTVNILAVGQDAGTGAESLANANTLTVSNLGTLTNTVQFDCTQTAAVDVTQIGLAVERIGL